MTRADIIQALCLLQAKVCEEVIGYHEPNDCFCEGGAAISFRSSGTALKFITDAVNEKLSRPASRFVPGSDPIASNTTNQSGPVASDRPVPPSCFHPEIVNTLHGSACLRCGDEVEGVPV